MNGMGGKLDDYRAVAPRGSVDFMLRIAERLRGRRIVQVTVSRYGGGAAELLNRIVPILNDLGIETGWEVMLGSADFDAIVAAVSKGLAGVEQVVTEAMLARLHATCAGNAQRLPLDADLVIVKRCGPPAARGRAPPSGRWLWRYHADLSSPQPQLWNALRPYVDKYDAAVFSAPKFAAPLSTRRFVIAPSIDPLSERNREMPRGEQGRHLERLGVRTDKPILLQVGPFERLQDPLGVVNAYRLVKMHHDVRLVLAGPPPGPGSVFAETQEAASQDPDVTVLVLPPTRRPSSTRWSARRRSCCRSRSSPTSAPTSPPPCGRASPWSEAWPEGSPRKSCPGSPDTRWRRSRAPPSASGIC